MISFVNPWYLLLMPIAAGPFILHLLNRRKMNLTEFSSLFFLKKLRERRFRWLKLRDILLLILRTLILAFLVLALAGPVWNASFPLGKTKADVVIIMDDSYSTSARFNQLKANASRLAGELSAGSRVILLTPSRSSWDTLWNDVETMRGKIRELEPSRSGRDLKASWDASLKLASGSKAATRIIAFISDGQQRALEFLAAERIPSDIEVYCFIDQNQPPVNTYIVNAAIYPDFVVSGEEQTLLVRVRRDGPPIDKTLSVWNGSKIIDERRIRVGGFEKEVQIKLPEGYQNLKVSLDSDSIAADDERFVLSSDRKQLRVAFVGDTESGMLLLALSAGGGVDVEHLSPAAAAEVSRQGYDALVWDGADDFIPQVNAAVSQGVPVLALLDKTVADVPGVFTFVSQNTEAFDILGSSKLFADFSEGDRREIRFMRYIKVQPRGGQTILPLAGGDPLMIADTIHGVYYLTTRFTLKHTDIVYRALFPAFVQRILVYVAGQGARQERLIGDTLRVRVPTGKALFVETPELRYEIAPRQVNGSYLVEFAGTNKAGFYRIASGTFVVNPDSAETSALRIKSGDLEKRGVKIYPLGSSTPRKLWLYFLILAAVMLAAEFVFIFL